MNACFFIHVILYVKKREGECRIINNKRIKLKNHVNSCQIMIDHNSYNVHRARVYQVTLLILFLLSRLICILLSGV